MVTLPEDNYHAAQQGVIAHYGTPRHSGRYPWGSGEDPQSQRNHTLVSTADELRKQGLTETEIARGLGITTTELRDIRTLVRIERQQDEIHMAQKLKDKGMSNVAIAKQMSDSLGRHIGESQVRSLLKPHRERNTRVIENVADTLRKAVDEKDFIDVGSGVEYQLNITSTKLRSTLQQLKNEGYVVHEVKVEQLGTGNQTNMKVLAKPGTSWGEVQRNRHNIQQLRQFSENGGRTILDLAPPKSISSKRVGIRYDEDGGSDADGVMYVRDGVSDVSLGKSRYAQVRVMVDGTHYLKGMAIKVDGSQLPDGVDILFNTNKKNTGNKLDAMKELKKNKDGTVDQDNPFGATISRQIGVVDPKIGKVVKPTSVMNIVNEEGKWDEWSRNLSSQMLSKQQPALAKEQLDKTYIEKKSELDTIMRLTNPAVRKKLLEAYSDSADSAAVHLKAAALPRQKTQVILPVNSMKTTEVYAPNFNNGERVALIRFPHGGTFEIPELTVNNRNPVAKKLLGNSTDAIGINSKVAERLSGADFDGDTVLVIPNNLGKVKSTSPLEGLKKFDPKSSYPHYEGMKVMSPYEKGIEMGKISNLITDMTIGGANSEELARAVKHSMVVIDAEKHKLDYKRSYADNGIAALVKKYQPKSSGLGGASTLISRARSRIDVPDRKPRSASKGGPIDPVTGKKVYEQTGRSRTWVDENGKTHTVIKKIQSTKLAETDDAHTLSSGTVIEKVYADHSNRLKGLANQARKEMVSIKSQPYNRSARETYRSAVESLNSKIRLSLENAPLERQAQIFASANIRLKTQANPDLKLKENAAELKRMKSQALTAARIRTGAIKHKFEITDEEWEAIQAGAITAHKLDQILTYADLDRIKQLATPKTTVKMSPGDVTRARNLLERGYTRAEVAQALGVSVSTIMKELGSVEGEGD